MLDEEHCDLERDTADNDDNLYALGSINGHNVVIVCLPAGQIGNNPAAVVATQLRATFKAIRFGLIVGIGSGVPSAEADIRLGDVVVSQPQQTFGGVVQYDSGKRTPSEFVRTGSLNSPPQILLSAVTKVRANELRGRSQLSTYISKLEHITEFQRVKTGQDLLFKATYNHQGGPTCDKCNIEEQEERRPRESDNKVVVHYGTIASGNQVMRNAVERNKLSAELGGVLCFEMEAAGLMNSFPCLVVRGIYDYADSHKNKRWQPYAAGAAAAYAKEVLSVISLANVAKTRTAAEAMQAIAVGIQAIQDDTEFIREHTHDVEHRNLSEWISPTNYAAIQSDTLGRRQEGTGQWFLDAPEVASWREKPKANLFCPGIPGAGKTMVAAIAIDSLLKSAQSDSIGVAYVYCNYKSQKEQDITSLLAAILRQLIQTRPLFAETVKKLQKVHARGGTKPSAIEIFNVLQTVVSKFLTVYIVVDALDECRNDDGTRRHLLTHIRNLQIRSDVRLLATSRFLPDIVDEFRDSAILEIRASDDDVRRFVAGQMDRLPECIRRKADLQIVVQDKIAEAVDGMFLLARLYTDSLLDKRTARHVKTALDKLSKGSAALDSAYEEAIHRIESQLPGDYQQAKKVLSWITHSQRPLTTVEICEALAVELGDKEVDSENIPYVEDLVSVCAGLVAVDEESSIIRLVHYTTQEFFDRIRDAWIPSAHLEIASTCLTYLSFTAFRSGTRFQEHMLEQTPFLGYAAQYWGRHIFTVQEELCELACAFLHDSVLVSHAAAVTYVLNEGYHSPLEGRTGLHATAQFGLQSLATKMLPRPREQDSSSIDARDSHDRTALALAVEHGNESLVELLLNHGADIHAKCAGLGDTLQIAALDGHERIVLLLLSRGAKVNGEGGGFGSALQAASINGHISIVGYLLDGGADIDIEGREFGTALQAASYCGHIAVVKLLLDNGANLHLEGGKWGNALQMAAIRGHEELATFLLQEGAEMQKRSGLCGGTLQAATIGGSERLVHLLLTEGADINAQDGRKGTALQLASTYGRKQIVELLLDRGADINARGGQFDTALQAASKAGHENIVRMLVENGADVNAQGGECGNALQAALTGGPFAPDLYLPAPRTQIVELLLERGADINMQGGYHGSALQAAADVYRDERTLRMLLERGADVNCLGGPYGSFLNLIAFWGYSDTLQLAYEHCGASRCHADSHGRTPLQSAARGGYINIFKYLLNLGLDPNVQDSKGDGLLNYACSGGSMQIVDLVLNIRLDPSIQTVNWTALHWACRAGHSGIIEKLIEAGFRTECVHTSLPERQWSPASIALFHGHGEMLEKLPSPCRSLLRGLHHLDPADPVQLKGECTYWQCTGCFHDIYGIYFSRQDCEDQHYCFMCKPFFEHVHENHVWHVCSDEE